MFRIKDYSKPEWQSYAYPAKVNAERDIAKALLYYMERNLPTPPLYIVEV